MIRILVGGFVIAHGLVTAAMWMMPAKEGEPFRATHSWVIGDARSLAVALALVAAFGFVLAWGWVSLLTKAGGACSAQGREHRRSS